MNDMGKNRKCICMGSDDGVGRIWRNRFLRRIYEGEEKIRKRILRKGENRN